MIFINDYVKVILSNNILVEGMVLEYNDKYLKLQKNNDIILIHNPEKNIIMTTIIFKQKHIPITELDNTFEKIYNEPSENNLRIKKLAELQSLKIEQEKRIITDKLKDHSIGEVKGVKYGVPRFFKKQSA